MTRRSGKTKKNERREKKKRKWLHAGLLKDVNGAIKDVWYAFDKIVNRASTIYQIIYASDNEGTPFRNLNVGQIKRNLITWDDEHQAKWAKFLTLHGTWVRKKAMAGRKCQRQTLLDHWLDPRSRDRYPRGRDQDRAIGPPLNVVHSEEDPSLGIKKYNELVAVIRPAQNGKKCYPGTKIPLSTDGIKFGAWKEAANNNDPIGIAIDFLTGRMGVNHKFAKDREKRLDQIESAFYASGWRVYRPAMEQACEDMRLGASDALQSAAWRSNFPYQFDLFKGKELDKHLKRMLEDADIEEDFGHGPRGDDDDNDHDESNTGGDGAGESSSGTSRDNGGVSRQNSTTERDEVEESASATSGTSLNNNNSGNADDLFVPEERSFLSRKRSILERLLADRLAHPLLTNQEPEESDDFEYLLDESPLKGKGKAKPKTIETPAKKGDKKRELKLDDDLEIDDRRSTKPARRRYIAKDNIIIIMDSDDEFEESDDGDGFEVIKENSWPTAEPKVETDDSTSIDKSSPSKVVKATNDADEDVFIDEQRSSSKVINLVDDEDDDDCIIIDEEKSCPKGVFRNDEGVKAE